MPAFITREEYDLEIDLTLLRTEDGGKPRGIRSGYRCLVDIAGSLCVSEFHFSDQDREWLNPGETARVLVWTTFPNLMLEHFTLETPLRLLEGYRLIGQGRIIKFLNLENHAKQWEEQQARYEEESRARKAAALAKEQEERLALAQI
jgi:hypothetical protein